MADRLQLEVNTLLNTRDVPKQLKSLNANLVKSTATKIQIPIEINTTTGLQTLKSFIKEVNVYKDKINNTFKEVKIIDPKTGKVWENQDKIVSVAQATKTLTTETNKYGDALGNLVTRVKTYDSEGKILITQTKQFINAFGEQVTETKLLDENLKQLGDTTTKINKFQKELTTTTTQTKTTLQDAGKNVEALVTTTEKVGSKGEYLKTVITEYTDAQGYAVKRMQEFNAQGQQVSTTLTTKTKKLEQDTNATKKNSQASNENAQSADKNAKAVTTLGQSFSSALTQLTRFYLASLPLRAITTIISEAKQSIVEFDKAITEMGKVSDLSGERLKKYTEDLGRLGKEVARTRTEMVEGATGWLKAGYSEEDAAKLAKYSALLQNTADEELTAAEATSILVSQLKAYHMEADEAIKVTDIINAVSAEQAVSSYDISQGLTVASAAMATFGNSIEETTALLTAGTTIFQGRATQVARG